MPDHRHRALAVVLLLGVALAACSNSTPKAQPSPSASTPSPSPIPPPPILAPLTGLPVSSKAIAGRPALAIKIDNATGARPHAGLDKADIVYEEPVEGGITRFIAIFQSRDAAAVGPIRSARLADIDVLAEYGRPALAFSGAAGYVLDALAEANLVLLPHGRYGSIYRREPGRRAPHNLMSSTAALYEAAGNKATPAPALFTFGDLVAPPGPSGSPSPSGTPADGSPGTTGSASPSPTAGPSWPSGKRVRVPFSSSSWTAVWTYHAGSGLYRRSHGSVAHRAANGNRITARNILVMSVRARSGSRRDGAGNTTPELSLVGSGRVVLLRDGVRIVGRWSRPSLTSRTTFTDKHGRPLVLAPGNTWIELVPGSVRPRYA